MVKSNISGAKQREITAAISAIVGDKLATLTAEHGDRLIANLPELVRLVRPYLRDVINEVSAVGPPVLELVNDHVQLSAVRGVFDPGEFRLRQDFKASADFHRLILTPAMPIVDLPAITLTCGKVVTSARDFEIKRDPLLSADPVFVRESEFVARLSQLLSMQPNCKEGILNNQGCWNLFYVGKCVVAVYASDRNWFGEVWELNCGALNPGAIVFGRN